jgi:hypothetical protein
MYGLIAKYLVLYLDSIIERYTKFSHNHRGQFAYFNTHFCFCWSRNGGFLRIRTLLQHGTRFRLSSLPRVRGGPIVKMAQLSCILDGWVRHCPIGGVSRDGWCLVKQTEEMKFGSIPLNKKG